MKKYEQDAGQDGETAADDKHNAPRVEGHFGEAYGVHEEATEYLGDTNMETHTLDFHSS